MQDNNTERETPDWWHLADVVADALELLRDNGDFDMAREHPEHPDDKRGAALMALRAYQLALADLARLSPDSRLP